ncbi:MAG: electron transfer flavoprotein subunit beta [Clostridiales bacterium]|nr:electron transfer flavoprotein subunit beta [Clostridiales bacterium]
MNILVFVKQVPDDYVKVRLGEDGKPAVEGIDKIVNAFDTYAVEMAVRHREQEGGRVVVATVGEEEKVRPAVVQMVAVGADQAYIFAPAAKEYDESALSGSLAEAVRECEKAEGICFDLVLCGKESTDEISSQVAAMLAEKLGAGFVSSAVGFEAADGELTVQQETETGYSWYGTACPAVLSVAKPEYDPRYPTLKGKMAARKANIPYFKDVLTPVSPAVACRSYAEPPKRKEGIRIVEKEAADAVNKALEIMTGDKVL